MITIKAKTIENKELEDRVEITKKGSATLGELITITIWGIDNLLETLPKKRVLEIINSYMEVE